MFRLGYQIKCLCPAKTLDKGRRFSHTDTMMTKIELRRIRKRLDWSLARLADQVGVTEDTVRRWEAGSRNVPDTAERLIRILEERHGQAVS